MVRKRAYEKKYMKLKLPSDDNIPKTEDDLAHKSSENLQIELNKGPEKSENTFLDHENLKNCSKIHGKNEQETSEINDKNSTKCLDNFVTCDNQNDQKRCKILNSSPSGEKMGYGTVKNQSENEKLADKVFINMVAIESIEYDNETMDFVKLLITENIDIEQLVKANYLKNLLKNSKLPHKTEKIKLQPTITRLNVITPKLFYSVYFGLSVDVVKDFIDDIPEKSIQPKNLNENSNEWKTSLKTLAVHFGRFANGFANMWIAKKENLCQFYYIRNGKKIKGKLFDLLQHALCSFLVTIQELIVKETDSRVIYSPILYYENEILARKFYANDRHC